MSDKSFGNKSGEPVPDPVDEFMRQLATNAARHRRTISSGGGVAKMPFADRALAKKSDDVDAGDACEPDAPSTTIEDVTVTESADRPGCWTVEAYDSEGSVFQATFQGPDAEQRARDYAQWKYGGELLTS